jgi:hypothetical protein
LQLICLSQSQQTLKDGVTVEVLWVDDNPENNIKEMKVAEKSHGIKVHQKVSTKEAKDFLEKNPHLKDAPSNQFRIITDCFR